MFGTKAREPVSSESTLAWWPHVTPEDLELDCKALDAKSLNEDSQRAHQSGAKDGSRLGRMVTQTVEKTTTAVEDLNRSKVKLSELIASSISDAVAMYPITDPERAKLRTSDVPASESPRGCEGQSLRVLWGSPIRVGEVLGDLVQVPFFSRSSKTASGLRSTEDYLQWIASVPSVFSMPIDAEVQEVLQARSREKSTARQNAKDFARDSLRINGKLLVGSEVGIQGFEEEFKRILEGIFQIDASGGNMNRETAKADDLGLIIASVFSLANRTFSAGVALDRAHLLFSSDTAGILLKPESAEASPIDLLVYFAEPVDAWVASIKAKSVFKLYGSDGHKEVARIEASTVVELNLSTSSPRTFGGQSPRVLTGVVVFEIDKLGN